MRYLKRSVDKDDTKTRQKNQIRLVKTRKNWTENKHIKWSKNVYNDQNTHQNRIKLTSNE